MLLQLCVFTQSKDAFATGSRCQPKDANDLKNATTLKMEFKIDSVWATVCVCVCVCIITNIVINVWKHEIKMSPNWDIHTIIRNISYH